MQENLHEGALRVLPDIGDAMSKSNVVKFTERVAAVEQATPGDIAASMTLFDIDQRAQELFDKAHEEDAATGAVSQETFDALQIYIEAEVQKVDRVAAWIKHNEMLDSTKKAEKQRLDARGKRITGRIERTKHFLALFMRNRGIKQIDGKLYTLSLVPNSQPTVTVTDDALIPDAYKTVTVTMPLERWKKDIEWTLTDPPKVEISVDKTAIHLADKAGVSVPGVKVEHGDHIRLS